MLQEQRQPWWGWSRLPLLIALTRAESDKSRLELRWLRTRANQRTAHPVYTCSSANSPSLPLSGPRVVLSLLSLSLSLSLSLPLSGPLKLCLHPMCYISHPVVCVCVSLSLSLSLSLSAPEINIPYYRMCVVKELPKGNLLKTNVLTAGLRTGKDRSGEDTKACTVCGSCLKEAALRKLPQGGCLEDTALRKLP